MALALAGARGQGGNTLNSLHPCPLPQRAPFAAVRRVSPLCAAFCPDNECVCGVAEKAHVAPTCGQRGKSRIQNAEEPRRSGKNPPVREEPASHLASRRCPGVCQMPNIGQKPIPTSCERRKICEKINNSVFESQNRIWKRYAEKRRKRT